LGPVLVLATLAVMGPFEIGSSYTAVRFILLIDLCYVIALLALVVNQVARLFAARRAKSAGSRLHLRLMGVFTLLAFLPTVTVAVFAGLTVNIGLEGWFSDRVQTVLGTSLAAAEAYEDKQRRDLAKDALALAEFLNNNRRHSVFLDEGALRQLLVNGQGQIQRGLSEAFVIDATSGIRARGAGSYLFGFDLPDAAHMLRASEREIVIIEAWDDSEFRALVKLDAFVDRYLYVSREVDGNILNLLDDTQETVKLYQQLERDRGRVLFEFGLLYLGFAAILILAATWLGLWFAERLARPVGRLTNAARRVAGGDLTVRVPHTEDHDEIATLSRYFNEMTKELDTQRQSLLETTRQIESRRRLFDSVLSSVSSGVVGVDRAGGVTFVNTSAERLLDLNEQTGQIPLSVAVPEFAPMFEGLKDSRGETAQGELRVTRKGIQEILLVRMATRRGVEGRREGYVVAFEDVTDLVGAQRMAAWGDVARRIAHEIKNPLTPIQLSAERISRKFARRLDDADSESLQAMTEVIVRQTGDLRRIVDEFSKFARMPEPVRRAEDLVILVSNAVLLQQTGQPNVQIIADLPAHSVMAQVDAAMIGQALTNLIKNAGEAIETRVENGAPDGHVPRITVQLSCVGEQAVISISDTGIGLPEDRARLFEPYVTTRDAGTGLGLPIVKKIIEEHGGSLTLEDATPLSGEPAGGAMAEIRLSVLAMDNDDLTDRGSAKETNPNLPTKNQNKTGEKRHG
jgi:two-component system nitrogen regulation sensor histidine kinase NtrY